MPATPAITVRLFEERDLPAAIAVLDAAFQGWPGRSLPVAPADHLQWKLASHPEAWRGQWVAEAEGQLIGTHFCLVAHVWLGGRRLIGSTGADSCVLPHFRERHVYTALRQARFEAVAGHFDFSCSRGAHVAVNRARERRGEQRVGIDVELVERRLRPLDSVRRRFQQNDRPVEQVAAFDAGVSALFEAARGEFDAIVERTPDRLNWRYADPRGGTAAILRIRDTAGDWRGYAVVRRLGQRALLSDLLTLPGDTGALDDLLAEAVRVAGDWGARVIRAWAPQRHPYREAVGRAGFRVTGHAIDLRYSALGESFPELEILGDPSARLHLTMGDTDAG